MLEETRASRRNAVQQRAAKSNLAQCMTHARDVLSRIFTCTLCCHFRLQ